VIFTLCNFMKLFFLFLLIASSAYCAEIQSFGRLSVFNLSTNVALFSVEVSDGAFADISILPGGKASFGARSIKGPVLRSEPGESGTFILDASGVEHWLPDSNVTNPLGKFIFLAFSSGFAVYLSTCGIVLIIRRTITRYSQSAS